MIERKGTPGPWPRRSSRPEERTRPLPALTPRIPRSRGAATAGIHAAMPGRRDPPPEVAVSPDRRGDQDRKPPPWARPPPAVRRPRAAGVGPRHTGACALLAQGPALPLARPTLRQPLRTSFHQQVLPSLPRSTSQVPGPAVSFPHASASCALGGTSLSLPYPVLPPATFHRQPGFSTEEFGFLSPENGSWEEDLKQECYFQICVLERSLRLLRGGRTVGGWN